MARYVVNLKNVPGTPAQWPGTYVYVGRPGRGQPDTGFGNPFVLKGPSEQDRADCVLAYADWLRKPEQRELRRRMVRELRHKFLVCFCAPKLCHADVIDALVNR